MVYIKNANASSQKMVNIVALYVRDRATMRLIDGVFVILDHDENTAICLPEGQSTPCVVTFHDSELVSDWCNNNDLELIQTFTDHNQYALNIDCEKRG